MNKEALSERVSLGSLWCPNSGGPYEVIAHEWVAQAGPNSGVSPSPGVRLRGVDGVEVVYTVGQLFETFARTTAEPTPVFEALDEAGIDPDDGFAVVAFAAKQHCDTAFFMNLQLDLTPQHSEAPYLAEIGWWHSRHGMQRTGARDTTPEKAALRLLDRVLRKDWGVFQPPPVEITGGEKTLAYVYRNPNQARSVAPLFSYCYGPDGKPWFLHVHREPTGVRIEKNVEGHRVGWVWFSEADWNSLAEILLPGGFMREEAGEFRVGDVRVVLHENGTTLFECAGTTFMTLLSMEFWMEAISACFNDKERNP